MSSSVKYMYIFVDSGFEDGNMEIDSDPTLPVSDAENSLITTTTGATGVSGVMGPQGIKGDRGATGLSVWSMPT